MDWVMVIVGAVEASVSIATAQFETQELCQAAADYLRENIKSQGRDMIGAVCLPATEAAR
jgi:hypothetical protein